MLGGTGVANSLYYVKSDGKLTATASDIHGGERNIVAGYGLNTQDLFVEIKDYGKKAT